MNINEAIDILREYNEWRRGKIDDMPDNHVVLGMAIDCVIDHFGRHGNDDYLKPRVCSGCKDLFFDNAGEKLCFVCREKKKKTNWYV
jgi:hypothetical protein